MNDNVLGDQSDEADAVILHNFFLFFFAFLAHVLRRVGRQVDVDEDVWDLIDISG